MPVVKYEIGKITRWYLILIFIVLVIVKCVLISFTDKLDYSDQIDEVYVKYINQVEGSMTAEKERYIIDEWRTICYNYSNSTKMQAMYMKGKITRQEFSEYNTALEYAQGHKSGIDRLMEDYKYIKDVYKRTHSKVMPQFLYSRYWDMFFSSTSVGWIPLILIIVFSVFCYAIENSAGMWKVINSCYNGKVKMLMIKSVICGLTGGIISFVYTTAEYFSYKYFMKLPLADAPVQSLKMFRYVSADISIRDAVVLLIVWRCAAGIFIGILSYMIASLIGKDIISFIVLIVIMFAPVFAISTAPWIFSRSICGLYNGVNIVIKTVSSKPMLAFGVWFMLLLTILICFGLNLVRLGYRRRRYHA